MTMATEHEQADQERAMPEGGLPLGPESLTWQYFADRRMALLGPRAAVLQNMLPALGQGVEDHSVWFAETLARLQRSIPPIFNTVYGADPTTSGHEVRDFHRHIKGKLPDGRPYSALNPETYYWAHATFVEHLVVAIETFIRPLSSAERDQIIAESVTWFERYGVSARDVPRTWAEFETYWARHARRATGQASDGRLRGRLRNQGLAAAGAGARACLGGGLAAAERGERLHHDRRDARAGRELLDLPWTPSQERAYRRFARGVRALDPVVRRLPRSMTMHPIAARAFARTVA